MGKTENGPFGKWSGLTDNLVGVISNGKNYVRRRPRKSSVPRSVPQAQQRTKMSLLTPIFKNLKSFLAISFKEEAIKKDLNPYNAAKSINLKTGIKGIYPNQEIDWEGIFLAEGTRAQAQKVTVNSIETGFEIHWDANYDIMNGAGYDRTMIYVYCVEHSDSFYSMDGARRSELKDLFEIGKGYKGKTFHIYLIFKDARSDEVSKSLYCGCHIR